MMKKMDIEFKAPFSFSLEVIETDGHIPSLLSIIQVEIKQFHDVCKYEGEQWIQCSVWDAFVQALHVPSDHEISLHDMSNNFSLSIQKKDHGIMLTWKFSKDHLNGNGHAAMSFTSIVDEDVLAKIRQQFNDFPAWW